MNDSYSNIKQMVRKLSLVLKQEYQNELISEIGMYAEECYRAGFEDGAASKWPSDVVAEMMKQESLGTDFEIVLHQNLWDLYEE